MYTNTSTSQGDTHFSDQACVSIYIYIHILCIFIYTWIHSYIYPHTYTHFRYIYIFVYIYIHIFKLVKAKLKLKVVHVYKFICENKYIHICIHIQVEYLDEVLLRDFLERRAVKFSGLLQKWVDPKGQSNSMVHAIWTQKMCKVTCLTNVKSMSDRRSTMYERAVTFDGADSFTRRDPVSSTVHNHIEHLCSCIANHVAAVTDEECEIQRCTSYFKVRSDGKVVYMWSSSLRVNSDENTRAPLATRTYSPVMSVPHTTDVKYNVQRERNYVCPVSNKVCGWNEAKSFISYKMIIQEWNGHYAADAAGQKAYHPSSARFRPSSARTPRQASPEAHEVRRSLRDPDMAGEGKRDNADDEKRAGELRDTSSRAMYARRSSHPALTKPTLTAENCVPELIRKLEKINDVDLYRRLLQDATFLYKQVRVCSEVAGAYTRFAATQQDPTVETGQGLGHFLDYLPLHADGDRPLTHRPSSARWRKEQVGITSARQNGAMPPATAIQQSTKENQRHPLLPRLDLGGRLTGRVETGEALQLERDNNSQRQIEDMAQHKQRLVSAREKAHKHSTHRYSQVPAQDVSNAPNTQTHGLNIFTDWKKECKNDNQRIDSIKQRVAVAEAAVGAVAKAAAQPLAARPPYSVRSSVRSSHSGRPVRQFSMAAAAIDPVLANELAYHQEQAAISKKFLDQMIQDTKTKLNLGSASAQPLAAHVDSDDQDQIVMHAEQQPAKVRDCSETSTEVAGSDPRVVTSAHEREVHSVQNAADRYGHEAPADAEQMPSHGQDDSDEQHDDEYTDSDDDHEEAQQEGFVARDAPAQMRQIDLARLHDLKSARQVEIDSTSWGLVQSEISSPRVDELADEMLLAALHMATDQEPEKHRSALRGILPELESDEQKYFLDIITDLKGYSEDALEARADALF